MEQVKIFYSATAIEREKKINQWLSEMGDKIEITRTNAVMDGGGTELTIIIFYKLFKEEIPTDF